MFELQLTDVVSYSRVSSEDQAERETIENQVDYTLKYCDLNRLDLADSFKDDGVSGTIPLGERPEGRRLLQAAKDGRIKIVLIYNLKRLGRSARVILAAVYELEQYGVIIKSMTEPFDTGNPTGRFLLTILAGVAELDRETTLETMWLGANRAARKGKWLGGIVPYGYSVNEERFLEVNEEPLPGKVEMSESDIVRLIFHLVANQKYTTVRVADYLNALEVPPSYVKDGRKVKKGKRKEATSGIWIPGRIGSMIKSTTYKGLHIYGKRSKKKDRELIEREVPAIVDAETWDLAQYVISDNQIEAMRNAKRQYLLRGLIKCGTCGLTYHGTSYPSGKHRSKAYYVCGGKTSYRGTLLGKCISKNVPAEWIENIVWSECENFIRNPGDAINQLEESIGEKKTINESLQLEMELIQKAIKDKDSDKSSILDFYRKKIINTSDVERQLQDIMAEKTALEERVKILNKAKEHELGLMELSDTSISLLEKLRHKLDDDPPFEIKREIVRTLVKEIIVHTDPEDDGSRLKAKVTVRYSFRKTEVNPRTVVRADITAMNTEATIALAAAPPSAATVADYLVHCLIGSIFNWRCRALAQTTIRKAAARLAQQSFEASLKLHGNGSASVMARLALIAIASLPERRFENRPGFEGKPACCWSKPFNRLALVCAHTTVCSSCPEPSRMWRRANILKRSILLRLFNTAEPMLQALQAAFNELSGRNNSIPHSPFQLC